jgi:hypothetical protein
MEGELISLCRTCHNRCAQKYERGRPPQKLDRDGYPIEPSGAAEKILCRQLFRRRGTLIET